MEEVGEGSRTVSVWVVWKDARAGKGAEGLVGGGGVVCGDKCYVEEVAWEVNGMLG